MSAAVSDGPAAAATHPTATAPPAPAFLLEVCCDSVASAEAADRGGAGRIELCSALVEGGLTPSCGLITEVRRRCKRAKVRVLIRPRAGDFLYSPAEVSIMRSDIALCRSLGVDGVVFGCLTADGCVDESLTRELVDLARPMRCTFHRAVDMARDLREVVKKLMEIGVDSLLTSGGHPDAIQGQAMIKSLVSLCGDRLEVLAGGGLTAANIPAFVAATGVRAVHASLRGDWRFGDMAYRREGVYMGGEKTNAGLHVEYATKQADEQLIRVVTEYAASSNATHR